MLDMTKGKPAKLILAFALPLILSNLFQQAYNLVDTLVVGRFVGVEGLASVGASTPITQLFVSMGNGASMGISVLIGQLYGAKSWQRLRSGISTALICFLAFGLLLMGLGLGLSRPLLVLLETPEQAMADAQVYLGVYLCGLPFLLLYNAANSIYNGMGDSRKPLYFLIFSSVLNVGLDILFVTVFRMGVAGVAYATLIAQGLACLLSCGVLLFKILPSLPGEKSGLFERQSLATIVKIGLPTMLQLMSVSLGGILVQSLVNPYGSDVIAGYSAALKLHNLTSMVLNVSSMALSTFTAQNIGAKLFERPGQAVRSLAAVLMGYCVLLVGVTALLARPMIAMFAGEFATQNMIDAGTQYLYVVIPGHFIFSFMNLYVGICRGAGYMVGFTVSTMADIFSRCVLSFALNALLGQMGIWLAIPAGWVVGLTIAYCCYKSGKWKRNIIVEG